MFANRNERSSHLPENPPSKRFSKAPEKFGTGHPEDLIEAGASNNASLASGWMRAMALFRT